MPKRKRKIVFNIQEIPAGFSPLKNVPPKHYNVIYQKTRSGAIESVSWAIDGNPKTKKGMVFVNQDQVDEFLSDRRISDLVAKEKEPVPGASDEWALHAITLKKIHKDVHNASIHNAVVDKKISKDMAKIKDELIRVKTIAESLWDQSFKHTKDYMDDNIQHMKRLYEKIDNLNRHVCIQGALLFSLVEQLGSGREAFNKVKTKERIELLNRLLTQDEWSAGFALEGSKREEV